LIVIASDLVSLHEDWARFHVACAGRHEFQGLSI
jgi:hypothetical protein